MPEDPLKLVILLRSSTGCDIDERVSNRMCSLVSAAPMKKLCITPVLVCSNRGRKGTSCRYQYAMEFDGQLVHKLEGSDQWAIDIETWERV